MPEQGDNPKPVKFFSEQVTRIRGQMVYTKLVLLEYLKNLDGARTSLPTEDPLTNLSHFMILPFKSSLYSSSSPIRDGIDLVGDTVNSL